MHCPACKSWDVTCIGEGTYPLPAGIGFLPGDNKCSVVGLTFKGFVGECDICHRQIFNYTSKRKFKTYLH